MGCYQEGVTKTKIGERVGGCLGGIHLRQLVHRSKTSVVVWRRFITGRCRVFKVRQSTPAITARDGFIIFDSPPRCLTVISRQTPHNLPVVASRPLHPTTAHAHRVPRSLSYPRLQFLYGLRVRYRWGVRIIRRLHQPLGHPGRMRLVCWRHIIRFRRRKAVSMEGRGWEVCMRSREGRRLVFFRCRRL